MDVLVNASTLVKGGGIQVAASLIVESLKDDAGLRWHLAITEQIAAELRSLGYEVPADAEIFAVSPARNRQQRERLLAIEQRVKPDVVFTVFGPTYVKFESPHLLGVAVCWVTHSTWLAFSKLPGWLARLKTFASCVYRGYWLRFADRWVVEATNASEGMRRRIGIPLDKIDVVPNTCARVFRESGLPDASRPTGDETVRLLYVAAYYPHKHIEFVPEVAAALRQAAPDRRFEFLITLPDSEPQAAAILGRARELGVGDSVVNAGRVSLKELIELYRTTHICFMPSVLETFSATYPEAMALGRPVVASDLDFARAVCHDAAQYYAPTSAADAARAILELLASEELWAERIAAGHEVLAQLPDSRQKYELFVKSIRRTAAARNVKPDPSAPV